MPVTKSAKKEVRVAGRRQARNKSIRSRCKSSVTSAEKQIFSGKVDEAAKAVKSAISNLDKAAEQGTLHPNNVARRKSRLAKKLNAVQAKASSK